MSNQLACDAVAACAAMGGYDATSPDNPAVKASLSALLTPYLARKLGNDNPNEVSKTMNLLHNSWTLGHYVLEVVRL